MGLRFQRRIRIAPGIRLNFSRRGMSATVGGRGASVNIGRRGTYANVGLPGTGVSLRERLDIPAPRRRGRHRNDGGANPVDEPEVLLSREEITTSGDIASASLGDLCAALMDARNARRRLREEQLRQQSALRWARFRARVRAIVTVGGRFSPQALVASRARCDQIVARLAATVDEIDAEQINIDAEMSEDLRAAYARVRIAFAQASTCARIWDITGRATVDKAATRSAADTLFARTLTTILETKVEDVPIPDGVLCFKNRNGSDLYLTPAFLAMQSRDGLSLLELGELTIGYAESQFIETEGVPSDAESLGFAWTKSNKDGSPDRRFKDNRQIPMVRYGKLSLSSKSGLNEWFMFSNERSARALAAELRAYLELAAKP